MTNVEERIIKKEGSALTPHLKTDKTSGEIGVVDLIMNHGSSTSQNNSLVSVISGN